jgi:SAM-dependent methyltransferase
MFHSERWIRGEDGGSEGQKDSNSIDEQLAPLLGEFVWHSVTLDPTLKEVSEAHYTEVAELLARYRAYLPVKPEVLEVASYAHTTGYMLEQRLNVRATLLDISASNLRLGRRLAEEQGLPTEGTRLVAGDFHRLPFEDGQFDFVFICSALHHTMRWQQLLEDLIRVVTPGGLVLLQNEPLLREFCFYKFRTNRIESFTPFEKKLDELGIIRTVAQPYLGSRPESMFGMVENQNIPLDSLLDILAQDCTALEITLNPEACMASLEQEILGQRSSEKTELANWLATRLEDLIAEAAEGLGPTERGLGFSLPSSAEIVALSEQAANYLKALPEPGRTKSPERLAKAKFMLARAVRSAVRRLPAPLRQLFSIAPEHFPTLTHQLASTVEKTPSDPFREGLARLFGASVKIVVRKRGQPSQAAAGRLRTSFPEFDGVTMGFEPAMLKLLGQDHALIPDLQTATPDEIHQVFPVPEWRLETSAEGIRTIVSTTAVAPMHVALPAGRILILFRVHAARIDRPYRLALFSEEQELDRQDVYQSEAFLLAGVSSSTSDGAAGKIQIRTVPLDDIEPSVLQAQFAFSYAGVLNL